MIISKQSSTLTLENTETTLYIDFQSFMFHCQWFWFDALKYNKKRRLIVATYPIFEMYNFCSSFPIFTRHYKTLLVTRSLNGYNLVSMDLDITQKSIKIEFQRLATMLKSQLFIFTFKLCSLCLNKAGCQLLSILDGTIAHKFKFFFLIFLVFLRKTPFRFLLFCS